ncbi:hypothetical protein V1508DRAFT_421984 [Lipomyces doorenjongii]|uniref:uncharacterized protein n=1 Tax=Lipomyces doorenjongii TaxID=383834 RepID=UPI0034CD257F
MKCNWSTTDSKRQSSSTNIVRHLREAHSILPSGESRRSIKRVHYPNNLSTKFIMM